MPAVEILLHPNKQSSTSMQIYTCPEISTNRSTIRGKLLNIDLCPLLILINSKKII